MGGHSELAAEELREAAEALGRITGENERVPCTVNK